MFKIKFIQSLRPADVARAVVRVRERLMGRALSALYGKPVAIASPDLVALAGVVALWFWRDGERHLVMVRPRTPQPGQDARARFVSCMGLGQHPDMATAVADLLHKQLGETFARLLPPGALDADRVVAAPTLSLTDDDSGRAVPLQVLVWLAELRPFQLDVVKLPEALELVIVAEGALAEASGAHVSPTHRRLWHGLMRHLPKPRSPRRGRFSEGNVELLEDAERTDEAGREGGRKGGRVLH